MITEINIEEKFNRIDDHWHPRIVGELNGQYVKLAKLKGEFVWHDHADEDELFMVIKGSLHMDFRDRTTVTQAGGVLIVPRGVEHRPYTKDEEEVWVMLFEPKETKHTGDVTHAQTKEELEWI